MDAAPKPKRPASRLARTMRSLLTISVLGLGLILWNAYTSQRDESLASGPESPAQKDFFVGAADRPDIEAFFKGLDPDQRTAMGRNIRRYDDPKLVALAAAVLNDFHAPAREELTKTLEVLGPKYPEETAKELKRGGSFQLTGIFRALDKTGDKAIPFVVKQLEDGTARNNAVAYLVTRGDRVAELIIPGLKFKDKDSRMAAADALGKIRARSAVPALLEAYRTAPEDERLGFFTALGGVGDPSTQGLITKMLENQDEATPYRAQAALGLGRIGNDAAIRKLWEYASSPDVELQSNVASALAIAGDRSLGEFPGSTPALRLRVATLLTSPAADAVIARSLDDPALALDAARAASERPGLVPALRGKLAAIPAEQGELADLLITALESTSEGQKVVGAFTNDPRWQGLIARRR